MDLSMSNGNIIPGFDGKVSKELNLNLFEVDDYDDLIIIQCQGYLDTYNSQGFQDKIKKIIQNKYYKLIFDTTKINYISSTGIGAFTNILKSLSSYRGNLCFVGMQTRVFEVFKLLGFVKFFDFADTIEEAIKKLENEGPIEPIFPKILNCPICNKKLKTAKPGKFRCPECKTILGIDNEGRVTLV